MEFTIAQTIDLQVENRPKRYEQPLQKGDHRGYVWEVTVLSGGKVVALTGYTATMFVTRGEEETDSVRLSATISGNKVRGVIHQTACAIPGEAIGVMQLANGTTGQVVGIALCVFTIRGDISDAQIDPGNTIPSIDALLARYNDLLIATRNANTAAGNADTATAKANTAAAGADAKAKEAEKAAKKLSSVGVSVTMLESDATPGGTVTQTDTKTTFALNIPRGATGATGKTGAQGPKGDPGASNIRTVALSLAVSAWTGSGPYTATITRSDVTTKTWVDFNLSTASLANYAAAIDWSTETAGKIALTTAVKPTGTIAGTLVLMEVM